MDEWEYESVLKLLYDHIVEDIPNDLMLKIEQERMKTYKNRVIGPDDTDALINDWINLEMHGFTIKSSFMHGWYSEDPRRRSFIEKAYNELDLDRYNLNEKSEYEKGIYYALKRFAEETLNV